LRDQAVGSPKDGRRTVATKPKDAGPAPCGDGKGKVAGNG